MKKTKYCVMCVLLVIALMLSACGQQSVAVAPPEVEENTENVDVAVGDNTEATAPEEVTEVETSIPELEPVIEKQSLEILKTTEELAKENQGIFLIKNGNFYNLQPSVEKKTPEVNYLLGACTVSGGVLFYSNDSRDKKLSSYGDIPVPVLEKGDEIVAYDDGKLKTLKLFPAVFAGNFFSAYEYGLDNKYAIEDLEIGKRHTLSYEEYKSMEIKDANDQLVDKTGYLEKDKEYTISWFKGTQYNEIKLKPICSIYQYTEKPSYELEWQLTKNGYVRYDWSGVASGVYVVDLDYNDGGFVVEIP